MKSVITYLLFSALFTTNVVFADVNRATENTAFAKVKTENTKIDMAWKSNTENDKQTAEAMTRKSSTENDKQTAEAMASKSNTENDKQAAEAMK
jgi:hypothetical protein